MATKTNQQSQGPARRAEQQPVPFRPFHLIDLLDEWPFGRTRFSRSPWLTTATLQLDMTEHEGRVVVRTDLPGFKREDIDVSVDGNVLSITARREEEKESKEKGYHYSERQYGEFSRAVTLPEGVKTEAIDASYKDGVLEVTFPKTPSQSKQIKVPVK